MKIKYVFPLMLGVLIMACTPKEKPKSDTTKMSMEAMIENGEHLVTVLGCNDCHSPKKMTNMGPMPDSLRLLSGHPANEVLAPFNPEVLSTYVLFNMNSTATIGPWGTSFAANLTPDQTGIGTWTEEQFIIAMTKGKYKGIENSRDLLPPMPWPAYSHLTQLELQSIFAYLKSIKPVNNLVPMAIPPGLE